MDDASVDVLVVGAGPTGLALAASLRQRGLEPLVVDPLEAGANTSRAAVVHARTLEVLETIGATPMLLERGLRVPFFQIRDRDRELLRIGFTDLPSAYPFTLMCPQDETEAILLDRLRAFGGDVTRSTRATRIVPRDDRVDVTLEKDGRSRVVQAHHVVGCDGMHSTTREQAGIAFDGATYGQSFVLADVVLDWTVPADVVGGYFSPAGLVVVAPLPGGRHRIVATCDEAPETPSLAFVQGILDARGPQRDPARLRTMVWSARFRVHHRVAARMRAGRILLAGDAAHVHSPAGGQGMNTGIQDAIALADALAPVVAGGPDAGLDAWAARRLAHAHEIVRLTDRLTRAATARSTPVRLARNALLSAVRHLPSVQRRIAFSLAELTPR